MSVKLILSAFTVIFLGLTSVSAQSSTRTDTITMYCGPARITGNPPLFVIVTSKREIPISIDSFNEKYSDWVESIKILKDSAGIAKYGDKGKYGVILLYLRKEKLQEALRALKLKG